MHPFASFMRHAVALAEPCRWNACLNPAVGAVLVRDGVMVAEGCHTAYGQAHAEVECLRDAAAKGVDTAQCTLVVTLEPCNHFGQTPPCTHAIVEAGIKHVVIGLRDPNPKAAGGLEYLESHGVRVEQGVEEQLCRDLVADFLIRQTTERPYVILKLASTLDGRIATRSGHSQWVSSNASRARVQTLRAGVAQCGGAVLIGGGTFRADNPHLTVRNADGTHCGPHPLACIVTSRLPQNDADYFLLRERTEETIFLATPAAAASPAAHALREKGVRVWDVAPARKGHGPDLENSLVRIRKELNSPYVLCEGGGRLGLSLMEAGLVDEFHLHLAPCILGDNASHPVFDGRSPERMSEALRLRITRQELCGPDLHIILRPA